MISASHRQDYEKPRQLSRSYDWSIIACAALVTALVALALIDHDPALQRHAIQAGVIVIALASISTTIVGLIRRPQTWRATIAVASDAAMAITMITLASILIGLTTIQNTLIVIMIAGGLGTLGRLATVIAFRRDSGNVFP